MNFKRKSRYIDLDPKNPRAVATCDRSGFLVQHSDLVNQDEYAGKGKIYLNIFVHPDFYDEPNAQNLTPTFRPDPKPIVNPRPDPVYGAQTTIATSIGELNFTVANTDITITLEQFRNYGSFNFSGVLTQNIVVYVPNVLRDFYINNMTTGPFELGAQISGNVSMPLTIPHVNPNTLLGPILINTFYNLQFG